jgi:hypothetical protein
MPSPASDKSPLTLVRQVTRMPRLSRTTTQCRHNDGDDKDDDTVSRVTRMPRLSTQYYTQVYPSSRRSSNQYLVPNFAFSFVAPIYSTSTIRSL